MSLNNHWYTIKFFNQDTREEQYGIGLKQESYPHGYIMSELMKVIKPIPFDYSDDINIARNDILDQQHEEALMNAKIFLDNFYNPDIYRAVFFDITTYEYETKKVPDYEKPIYIVNEALELRKSIKIILQSNVKVDMPYKSRQGTIDKICDFREIEDLFKSRIINVSIMPELELVRKKLPMTKKKEIYLSNENDDKGNEEEEPIDMAKWEGVKRIPVLDIDYRYATENFMTLPWLELLHATKNNYLIYKCPLCNNYYFHYLKMRKNCEDCGYPSTRTKKETIELIKKNNMSAEQIEHIEKENEIKKIRARYRQYIKRGIMSREKANKELQKLGLKPIKEHKKKGGKK